MSHKLINDMALKDFFSKGSKKTFAGFLSDERKEKKGATDFTTTSLNSLPLWPSGRPLYSENY